VVIGPVISDQLMVIGPVISDQRGLASAFALRGGVLS
jgi:hypothetical protein